MSQITLQRWSSVKQKLANTCLFKIRGNTQNAAPQNLKKCNSKLIFKGCESILGQYLVCTPKLSEIAHINGVKHLNLQALYWQVSATEFLKQRYARFCHMSLESFLSPFLDYCTYCYSIEAPCTRISFHVVFIDIANCSCMFTLHLHKNDLKQ